MSINITHMVEDNVQPHLIKLASMSSSDLFEKIAIHVENPHMFKHFLGSNEEAPVWDFAYAAGLITRAEADLMNVYEGGGRAPWHKEDDNSGNKSIIMDATVNFFSIGSGLGLYNVEYSLENHDITLDYITVIYDGTNIRLPRDFTFSNPAFGETNENHSQVFTNYPIYVNFTGAMDSYNLQITNTDPGDHSIKIIIDQPGLPPVENV